MKRSIATATTTPARKPPVTSTSRPVSRPAPVRPPSSASASKPSAAAATIGPPPRPSPPPYPRRGGGRPSRKGKAPRPVASPVGKAASRASRTAGVLARGGFNLATGYPRPVAVAYIALGGNLGDRAACLRAAVAQLESTPG